MVTTRFAGSLTDHGESLLRRVALDIASAGLEAADPRVQLLRQVHREGEELVLAGRRLKLSSYDAVWFVGAGKASGPLARAVEELLDDDLTGGVVVVPEGSRRPTSKVEWLEGEHPVPGEHSFESGQRLLEFAERVGRRDLVISAVTGGSSALVAVPRPGITAHDKQEMNRMLLSCGADIREINTVRKHLSAIKGGRLAAEMSPACIVNLTVSDVAGDPIRYICDLTVQDEGCAEDAIRVLRRRDLWEATPEAVKKLLCEERSLCLPDLSGIDIETILLVTGESVCGAMAERTASLGLSATVLSTSLSGQAAPLGGIVGQLVVESRTRGRPFRPPIVLLACGGESTVSLSARDAFGAGGPNQEVALAAAAALDGCPGVVLLAMDTDGSDGGTAAAGGIVDGLSAATGVHTGSDFGEALLTHQSTAALAAIGDLVITGRTETNVNDLLVVVVDDEASTIARAAQSGGWETL